jgi:hypothetical protein
MELKLFTDVIGALGKVAGGLKAIVTLPVVDAVGVFAGAAVTVGAGILLASAAGFAVGAGAVAAAPVIIGIGLVAAALVGLYHLGGWLNSKLSD